MGYSKNNYGETPLVYIVLPLYNGEMYFLEQLMSIYYQNYTNWYLIIVNDGSRDSSEKIAQKFIKDYGLEKKVQIINKENGGLNSAITVGLDRVCELCDIYSSNALISYCDQDDIWTREKLAIQVEYMANNPLCGLSYHDVATIDENGIIRNIKHYEKQYMCDSFLHIATLGSHYCIATEMMFRVRYIDKIKPIPIGFGMYQDLWTEIIISLLGAQIHFIDKSLVYLRRGHTSGIVKYSQIDENKRNEERYKFYLFLQDRFPNNKSLEYVIRYKYDVLINWREKKYSNLHKIVEYILKYPDIFLLYIRGIVFKYFNI